MGENNLSQLLTPSLDSNRESGVPYSTQSHLVVAWFGGPLAIVGFAALSAYHMNQLKSRIWVFVGLTTLSLCVMYLSIAVQLDLVKLHESISFGSSSQSSKFVLRLGALCLYGVFYWFYRRQFAASKFASTPRPSPWLPGTIFTVVGIFLSILVTFLAG